MTPTSKILLRSDFTKKDGTIPIYLRLTINRKVKYFSLFNSCFEKHWNYSKCRISKTDPEHFRKNSIIDKNEIKAKNIIFNYQIKDKTLTFLEFVNHFKNDHYNNQSFVQFVKDQTEKYKNKFTPGTLKNYGDQLNKLQDFKPNISFSELNIQFMSEYEDFLKVVRKNNKNTIIKSLLFIKNMLNKAVSDGLIKENLCSNYKLGRIEGDREYLTLTELETLSILYYNNSLKSNKQNVLRYFLFCCYTGLRYSDIKSLKFSDINESTLKFRMQKTKEIIYIPLIDKAKILIPYDKKLFKDQPVFKVLTDQPTNRYLKDIIDQTEITKSISFHCSRHTFATIGITLGIPLEVISKLLGHTDLKTTQIYAKIEESVKVKEMKKWEYQ